MTDPQPASQIADLLERLDEDLAYVYHERAAIMEFDGRIPRDEAELLALADLLRSHPGAFLGLRFARLELCGRSELALTTDLGAAYDRVRALDRTASLHDVDDPAALVRETFGGLAVLGPLVPRRRRDD